MIDRSFNYSITNTHELSVESQPAGELARRANLEYHIMTGDFLLLLATLFGFFEETAADPESVPADLLAMQAGLAKTMRQDLRYLAEKYEIRPLE